MKTIFTSGADASKTNDITGLTTHTVFMSPRAGPRSAQGIGQIVNDDSRKRRLDIRLNLPIFSLDTNTPSDPQLVESPLAEPSPVDPQVHNHEQIRPPALDSHLVHAPPPAHSHQQPHAHAAAHSHSHSHSHDSDCGGHGLLNHHHDHSHLASNPASRRALKWALWINVAFLIAEVAGGIIYNSVALLSDAAHMLTDVGALALALVAATLAARPATSRRTYGFGRVEPLAALINSVTLILASGWIIYEATTRLIHPEPVNGAGVMIIALGGLAANGVATWILMRADQTNLNIRAAMMHSLIDAISSVGVLVAGAAIALTGWNAIDPLASYLIAGLAIAGTWGILRRSLDLVLDASPESTDVNAIAKDILAHPATTQVHDIHVWSIGSNRNAMTAHVLIDPAADLGTAIDELEASIRHLHNIDHVTLQLAPDRSRMLLDVAPRLSHPRAAPPEH